MAAATPTKLLKISLTVMEASSKERCQPETEEVLTKRIRNRILGYLITSFLADGHSHPKHDVCGDMIDH